MGCRPASRQPLAHLLVPGCRTACASAGPGLGAAHPGVSSRATHSGWTGHPGHRRATWPPGGGRHKASAPALGHGRATWPDEGGGGGRGEGPAGSTIRLWQLSVTMGSSIGQRGAVPAWCGAAWCGACSRVWCCMMRYLVCCCMMRYLHDVVPVAGLKKTKYGDMGHSGLTNLCTTPCSHASTNLPRTQALQVYAPIVGTQALQVYAPIVGTQALQVYAPIVGTQALHVYASIVGTQALHVCPPTCQYTFTALSTISLYVNMGLAGGLCIHPCSTMQPTTYSTASPHLCSTARPPCCSTIRPAPCSTARLPGEVRAWPSVC